MENNKGLDEARKWANSSRELQRHDIEIVFKDQLIIILDNRITELEAQKDELVDACRGAIGFLEQLDEYDLEGWPYQAQCHLRAAIKKADDNKEQ